MHLTREQAKALGLGHLYLYPAMKSQATIDGMNKLERAFWEMLDAARKRGECAHAWREPFTFRLAGRTTYRPDFAAVSHAGGVTLWEVKGFMRDDAAVKIKVAAAQFPCFYWVLVTREKRAWQCRHVTARGIDQEVYCPDWLS